MTATSAPALSAAEQQTVEAFDAAPYPVEVAEAALVETVARALADASGELDPRDWAEYRRDAAAAISAYRAAQDGGAEEAVRRVEALAESWRYKGEFGWGPWQAGEGPDLEGMVLDQAATELRAALATQADR